MHRKYMERALELAALGKGNTNPNPMVGAVLVKDGRIIGEGFHNGYGGPHAEVVAFDKATEEVAGATLYVTLEPCAHHGKTPPCADLIVRKGVREVHVAMVDPNPLVAGRGIRILEAAGIMVHVGAMEDQARALNEIFLHYITTGRPYVVLKTAMTLDGKIATVTGASKWITGEDARRHVHLWRKRVGGILVGIGTVLEDDPELNVRYHEDVQRQPARIVVDSAGRIPLEAKVLRRGEDTPVIVATTERMPLEKRRILESQGVQVLLCPSTAEGVDLAFLLEALGRIKVDSVLVEGGGRMNHSFLQSGLVDKALFYIAPKIFGGETARTPVEGAGVQDVEHAYPFRFQEIVRFDDDILIVAQPKRRGDNDVHRLD